MFAIVKKSNQLDCIQFETFKDMVAYLITEYADKNEFLKEVLTNDPDSQLDDENLDELQNVVEIYVNEEILNNCEYSAIECVRI